MRNLKKFLALVMAMVMAFSLMLTVNAKDIVTEFGDRDQVDPAFAEAVDVLSGMKVFQGDEGGFRPASNITRGEVAAIIYRLATGDTGAEKMDLYTTTHPFTDVGASDWFAGYVGYCANAGYIKGHGGYFNPYGNVTGYEALAMVLRAIGYDKNHEFEGATWQTNVSALGTQLGILDDIKTTDYANTLHLASRRDVVASILFNAAIIPQVQYTPAFGYQTTGMSGGVIGTTDNPSLGYQNFQLKKATGAIVGNQETGEKVTVLGVAGERSYAAWDKVANKSGGTQTVDWSMYNYPGTSVVKYDEVQVGGAAGTASKDNVTVNNSQYFNWTTEIGQFAHKVDFWYKEQASKNNATSGQTVYAMFDRVKKTQTVWAADEALNTANANDLGTVAKANGFTLNNDKDAVFNTAFDRLWDDGVDNTASKRGSTGTNSPSNAYLLVSNSDDNKLDVVVELHVQTSKVTGVNNVGHTPYVTVTSRYTGAAPEFIPDNNLSSVATEFGSSNYVSYLAQKALVGDSTKTLSDYEIGYHIVGTATVDAPAANNGRRDVPASEDTFIKTLAGRGSSIPNTFYFKLDKVEEPVVGTVSSYHPDTTDPSKGYVILSDGTKLERSPLYSTVVGTGTSFATLPQTGTIATEAYSVMQYKFYLDREGKYIGAEPVFGTEFVYGTYMDFQTELGSSSYTYRLVGVNIDGELVTKDVKKYASNGTIGTTPATDRNNPANAVNVGFANAGDIIDISDADKVTVPFRGDATGTGTGYSTVRPGRYNGFAVNSSGVMSYDTTKNTLGTPMRQANEGASNAVFTWDVEVKKFVSNADGGTDMGLVLASKNALGDSSVNNLYFTENTKFILVTGTGTDTQKTKVYNGISDLLGTNSSVYFNLRDGADAAPYTNNSAAKSSKSYHASTPKYADMTFLHEPVHLLSGRA